MLTGKEVVKNMEYMLKLLHTEWGRSGKTTVKIAIAASDTEEMKQRLAAEIAIRQEEAAQEHLTFEQCMKLTKQNFILLRMIKKMEAAAGKCNKQAMDTAFTVELDKEEYILFILIIEAQEG